MTQPSWTHAVGGCNVFFQFTRFDYDAIARMIMQMFGFNEQLLYLVLDRTNWKWGQKNLNILFLAVVYKGTAIPVYWLVLNKQGRSRAVRHLFSDLKPGNARIFRQPRRVNGQAI